MPVTKNGKFRFDNVRVSFTKWLYEADENDKYSVSIIIDPNNPCLEEAKHFIEKKAKEKWGEKAAAKLKQAYASNNVVLRSGDTKDTDRYPEYEGMMTMNAYSKKKPVMYAADRRPITENDGTIYSGCYCNVIVDFWIQDDSNRKGVNGALEGLMFVKDGERLGGGRSVTAEDFGFEDEFEEAI